MKRRAGLQALAAAGLAALAPSARGRVWQVGADDRLHEVVAAARDGDTIELAPGDHRGQTAVITQRALTLRAASGTAVLHADGAHAEGKALIVVRGGDVTIEQIEFRGARVPSGNGAGIRFERGRLTLRRCAFFDNEMGLLSANVPDAELVIEDCEFGQAPRHEGPLHHLLYVGAMRRLHLSGCRFSGGWRGHLVKSRAAHNLIVCNQLVDGDEGEASYELDLPNGGLAWVLGNVLAQGPRPQNAALIAFGAEANAHPDSALFVAHNSLINESAQPAAFVRHWPERLPAQTRIQMLNNLLIGARDESTAQPADDDNPWRPLSDLDRATWPRVALRSSAASLPVLAAAGMALGVALTPQHQISFPLGKRALAPRELWQPGAFQD